MTQTELRQWIAARELSHKDAAMLLGLTLDALRQRIYGRVAVDPQTARIAELLNERRDGK